MAHLIKKILNETGCRIEELNLGGGLGIRYISAFHPPSIAEFVEEVCRVLSTKLKQYRLEPPLLMMEPGRSIVGDAGTTLYTVGPVKIVPIKEAPGYRIYVAVDGGLSDNPRPQMYGSKYEAILSDKANLDAVVKVTIAGKHCETDVLIYDAMIAKPEPGDILAVQCTGAYNHSMASNYNRLPRPAVVLASDGRAAVLYRRETMEDLTSRDEMPERLRCCPKT
jgi:diaminopimelate decarboxylase